MAAKALASRASYRCYRVIRWLVQFFYPKITVVGQENLPDAPVIAVGNHSQIHGPITAELYYPGKRRIWCAGQMMHMKEVPAYAYQDFWSGKPKWSRWFFRILSYLIAPIAACVFNNAFTIPVYRDTRLLNTFRQSVSALEDGSSLIIFPECAAKHNSIVNQFQDKFIDVAKLYYKRTGKAVSFVPMYLAPALKTLYLGTPIPFRPDVPIAQERERICGELMEQITKIGTSLPRHRVVPYNNVSKKEYPYNISSEVSHEETGG